MHLLTFYIDDFASETTSYGFRSFVSFLKKTKMPRSKRKRSRDDGEEDVASNIEGSLSSADSSIAPLPVPGVTASRPTLRLPPADHPAAALKPQYLVVARVQSPTYDTVMSTVSELVADRDFAVQRAQRLFFDLVNDVWRGGI